jgi:FHA domain/CHAT domain
MPSLNLAIDRLTNTGTHQHFAIWVVNAPDPGGHTLRDCFWSEDLTGLWQQWHEMFSTDNPLELFPDEISSTANPNSKIILPPALPPGNGRGVFLMQSLAIGLWRWVFEGKILNSMSYAQGSANASQTPLRLRLEIRDPRLIYLPWEIMQPEVGQAAISLYPNLLFSRTSSKVDPLPALKGDQALNILLVLGEDARELQLQEEADLITQSLSDGASMGSNSFGYAPCMVKTLLQPTPQELIAEVSKGIYNAFFYSGHGETGPDGGFLLVRPGMTQNGMELAQVLSRSGVKLAVFNACWLAKPGLINEKAVPYSSLAEVLISQGVPAVLGMRDVITIPESKSFIKVLATALRKREPIDQAVTEARRRLLTENGFNNSAWTLPILYLHPQFNGEILQNFDDGITILPTLDTNIPDDIILQSKASLRSLSGGLSYNLQNGVTYIGRGGNNNIVIPELSVSKRHAEIFFRITQTGNTPPTRTYFIKDVSTYGTTWIVDSNSSLQQIPGKEIPLQSGMQIKFGSTRSQSWVFHIEDS